MTAASELHWFTSSYSGGSGTECVEAAFIPAGILIRDSKRPDGPLVRVSDDAWRRFLAVPLQP
ncbi:DUF397 domain-containing protein [Streptomyces sp. NPDC127100]|uniref:DUF397 domain-containing protein n=1 Tax=Streptomyces sp. NPDC127100 TaxID=3347138 RepID=UPI0036626ACA